MDKSKVPRFCGQPCRSYGKASLFCATFNNLMSQNLH